jgi:hypothetical protein
VSTLIEAFTHESLTILAGVEAHSMGPGAYLIRFSAQSRENLILRKLAGSAVPVLRMSIVRERHGVESVTSLEICP